ncbi:maternal effect protein staufen-like [Tetranychus urticae]|uniref:DRBM domain-containing protein n=1 Tax=Tetranychus urticae TaxID=32264 RepID=T1KZX2_TETUR|nr:maternal effect protein staufen-like [Tetranychus urticae]
MISNVNQNTSLSVSSDQKGTEIDAEMTTASNDSNQSENIVNKHKDKSPMCLVNELCRFNSITCRYELIEESGVPHSKIFSVVLKLGDKEEYRANAPSIRKAQHAAASLALVSTKFPLPSPKSERKAARSNSQLTPTVELNVLAMKRREHVQYHVYEQPVRPNHLSNLIPFTSSITSQLPSSNGSHEHHDYRSLYHQRCHLVRGMMTPMYIATVVVGERQFTSKGKTIQIARHAAAEEALKTIRHLPMPTATTINMASSVSSTEVLSDDDSKSPVSMIYEAAMKRKLMVQFEVISESGPSHMPCFIVKCIVGAYSAEGRGVRKKTAKRRAAAAVLAELEEKEPIIENSFQSQSTAGCELDSESTLSVSPSSSSKNGSMNRLKKRKPNSKTKKKRKDGEKLNNCIENLTLKLENTSLVSENDSSSCYQTESETLKSNTSSLKNSTLDSQEAAKFDDKPLKASFSLNSISRLIQLQLAKREGEPRFKFISEIDVENRRKEFTIQCSVNVPKNFRSANAPIVNNELITLGVGSNKKIAKRAAAEEMLRVLGYSSLPPTSSSPSHFSNSLSPVLKMNSVSQQVESVQNCHSIHSNLLQCANTNSALDSVDASSFKNLIDNGKERRVKFLEESQLAETENISKRLEDQTENAQNSPKYGRQIAPGLLFVMSMNQTGYPILMDNNSVDKL